MEIFFMKAGENPVKIDITHKASIDQVLQLLDVLNIH